jgi:solute carrier family 25 carnitine/acylcarnitine transporter 20/29
MARRMVGNEPSLQHEAAKVLLCGGVAGIVTWASIFPLDVIKTRVQTQTFVSCPDTSPLLSGEQQLQHSTHRRCGAVHVAKQTYREGGVSVFFRGLTVCSVRAFIVNAVQWAVYEWTMYELGQGRRQRHLDVNVK